ncbi:phosphomannomutase/phosphoglucomutase [Enterococcus sp.]|uniref:phosphomannomutase/phosphoglucomutase n=1 Tax=Enterococcus sp. TaxID=35783 RepID=UPI0028A62BCA|nr:phosphomannomutase/phosphoglucomutase [Enterococcus sp.]
MTFMDLQNGSDIRGIAIATADEEVTLTEEAVAAVASGLHHWLASKGTGSFRVAVGRDSRLSGEALQQVLMTQLQAEGIDVIDCGLATTPAMFMSTQFPDFACDAGVMLTASHLPYYFNGIKVFSREGGAEKADIQYILSHSQPQPKDELGTYQQKDLITPYAEDLVTKIRQGMGTTEAHPLSGLKIIVDAGNGAGGFFAEKVLLPLGADTNGSQFLEPDGHFPNHIPNPDNQEAMKSITDAVLREQADLGIIFDTDVDRSAVVTKSGAPLNRNNMIAVLSKIVLAEHPSTKIVTNSPTSDHLKRFIESLGGQQVRYISGYRNVINKAIALNNAGEDAQLAIETSGHAAFKENYFLDDGAYVIAKILMILPELQAQGTSLEDLIATLKQPLETQELRFKINTPEYQRYGRQVIADFGAFNQEGWVIDPENEEGIRVKVAKPYGKGWFLLRMSLHEPLLVLQIENDVAGYLPAIAQKVGDFFNQYPAIDQSQLRSFLSE